MESLGRLYRWSNVEEAAAKWTAVYGLAIHEPKDDSRRRFGG